MKKITIYGSILYILLTLSILIFIAFMRLNPDVSFGDFGYIGPGTIISPLVASCLLTWMLITAILAMTILQKINRKTIVPGICGAIVSMLYLAFLREHVSFGDYYDYIRAAENILANQPFHARYVYPPLWASFLAHIYRLLGQSATILTIFVINHLSIVTFFILSSLFLCRCGLSLNFSSILVCLSLIINVPVLRNIVYMQVNFLLIDFILVSVLLFSRCKFFSAFSFALGIHLKVLPIFFLPMFLWTKKKWLWVLYLSCIGLLIMLFTILTDGSSYYVNFFRNLKSWSPTSLRACSIYGFLLNTNHYLGTRLPTQVIWNSMRIVLVGLLYVLSYVSIQKRSFVQPGFEPNNLISGIIPLFFLMVVLSPTVWVHHLVILIIPTILILLHLEQPGEIFLFAMGYFFTFLLPVFDLYPWSYLRLAGWMILLGLTMRIIISNKSFTSWGTVVDLEVNTAIDGLLQCFMPDHNMQKDRA